jgi:hypothetical protein
MRILAIGLVCMLLLAGTVGCAKYEYDILHPQYAAQHIGSKAEQAVSFAPLHYRMTTVSNRLVMLIDNPTSDPITLLGERSSVVDPSGQSHPLRTLTMQPGSYIKLILPPMRPRIEHTGPSFGIGFGTAVGYNHVRRGYLNTQDFYDEPRYVTVYDDDTGLYWDWDGESQIRLNLVFQRGSDTFEHEWVIARKQM